MFKDACHASLIGYLASHGYAHPVSPKLLSTNKEFGRVVAFLAARVDPGAPALSGRVEEEVPALFKRLRYPFAVPRSALQAVGSPHTWPALLAALAWLVELLQYDEQAGRGGGGGGAFREAGAPAGQEASELPFFDSVADSYAAFLSGDDAAAEALDCRLEAQQQGRDAQQAAACERLEACGAGLSERLSAARTLPASLPALHRLRDALQARTSALQADVAGSRAHLEQLAAQQGERRWEAAQREQELLQQRADNAALLARVAGQGLSSADVARLGADRAAAEGLLASVQAQAGCAEERAREQGEQAERVAEECQAALGGYHAACVALKALPQGAKRARQGAFELHLAPHACGAAQLEAAGERLRTAVRPGLESVRDEYRGRYQEAGLARLRLDEQLDASEAQLAEKREQRHGLEAQVARAEGALAAARERIQAAVALADAQAVALEAQAQQAASLGDAQQQGSDAQLAQLRAAYDDTAAQCAAEAAHTQQTLLAALDVAMVHKQTVQDALTRCGALLAALADGLESEQTQFTAAFAAPGPL